jgi:hypothetical protein
VRFDCSLRRIAVIGELVATLKRNPKLETKPNIEIGIAKAVFRIIPVFDFLSLFGISRFEFRYSFQLLCFLVSPGSRIRHSCFVIPMRLVSLRSKSWLNKYAATPQLRATAFAFELAPDCADLHRPGIPKFQAHKMS